MLTLKTKTAKGDLRELLIEPEDLDLLEESVRKESVALVLFDPKRLVIRESKSGEPRTVFLSDAVAAECRARVGRLCPFADSVSFNKRVRKLSGIERFRSHLCRHTFATEWRESGGSLAALGAALGHHDIRVTEKYGDTTEDLVEREAARLEQYRIDRGEETGHKTERVRSGNR